MPYLMGLVGLALPIFLILAVYLALDRLNVINQRLERIERMVSTLARDGSAAPAGRPEFPPDPPSRVPPRPPDDPFGGPGSFGGPGAPGGPGT